jgi:hypothetical protein
MIKGSDPLKQATRLPLSVADVPADIRRPDDVPELPRAERTNSVRRNGLIPVFLAAVGGPRTPHRSSRFSLLTVALASVSLSPTRRGDAARVATRDDRRARDQRDYAKFAAWEFSVTRKVGPVLDARLGIQPDRDGIDDSRPRPVRCPGPAILDNPKSSHLLCARDSSRYFFLPSTDARRVVT